MCELSPIDHLILALDGSQCVTCKGGQIVATEINETTAAFICRNCGTTGQVEV